jgi:signal transduction histidine kinase
MPRVSEKWFNRLVIAAVVVGFAALTGIGAFAGYIVSRNIAYTGAVSHTHEVRGAIAEARILTERIETSRRGYLLSLDESFYRTFKNASADRKAAVERVARLTADNPPQRASVIRLRDLARRQARVQQASIEAARLAHVNRATAFDLDRAVSLTREMRLLLAQMDVREVALLNSRNLARVESVDTLILMLTLGAVLLILVGSSSTLLIVHYTRSLTVSRDALRKLNEGLEDQVRVRTSDLQRANDEIQRFAYIVSHDLRSPLVNVMGFASELEEAAKPLSRFLESAEAEAPGIVTREARQAIEEDLPESIGFIRKSTQKMDRLINAILQLSRQGRRVLTPEPLDMTRLFEGVADNLRHRSTELGATIEVAPGLPDVVSDRLALEQIFSNLIENALKYLKPGRPGLIRVSGERHGVRVVYAVTDNGRGISPKDHDRIFDLFRRSGAQDQPGEGIGLAHVRALAYRLGGTVACESALDQGATFRVSLPDILTTEGPAR